MSMVASNNVLAKDIMVTRLVTLSPAMDALDAIRKLLKHRISGAPVVNEAGDYLGVFSEKTSMSFLLGAAYEQLPSNQVRAFMNTDRECTIAEEVDLLSIVQIFLNTHCRRLPVLRGEKLVGQISRRDVLSATLQVIDDHVHDRDNSLLYLSALVDREHAPVT